MTSSRLFRLVVWLVTVSHLVQPWLGQEAYATAMDSVDGQLVICTGTGFKTIMLSADVLPPGHPVEGQKHQDDASLLDCLACLVQALGQWESLTRLDQPSLYRYRLVDALVTDRWTVEPLCHRPLTSRAPPTV